MTTATESMTYGDYKVGRQDEDDEEIRLVSTHLKNHEQEKEHTYTEADDEMHDDSYSMMDVMDRRLIQSIEQYVQHNMNRGQFNLEEMASAMGMGMRPLFQKVRDLTGKTPSELVRDLRLKHACILLKRTNINMNELATNIGYASANHFISTFRERFGITPTEYRLKYRK